MHLMTAERQEAFFCSLPQKNISMKKMKKEALRRYIQQLTEEFLAKGGKIMKVPFRPGTTGKRANRLSRKTEE